MTHCARLLLCFVLLGATCALVSCGNDDPASPGLAFEPRLSDLWPHQDGDSWTFSMKEVEREILDVTGYSTPEDVPALPSFADLYQALHEPQDAGGGTARTGSMTLQFDGVHDVLPDVQVLRVTATGGAELPTPFQNFEALLQFEADRIAGYDEHRVDPGWIYLTANLERGDEFTEILFKDLGSSGLEITLHGRIWRHLSISWGGRDVNCVELVYLLDRGVRGFKPTVDSELLFVQDYGYGAVIYGEGIGPISWREKWIEYASSVTQDLPPISKAFDILISLESVDLAVAPAVSSNVP